MFEVLTADEARRFMEILTSGYKSSQNLARELSGWSMATTDPELQQSYSRDLLAQGGIRAENTAIRWQVKREALS